ncbi:MAG: glycosyltransferase family A protein [Candidatus Hodarchaeales archaeon]|jgi:hypothetical protein
MIIFVADMFANQYGGGAELTTEALIEESLLPCKKINSSQLNIKILEQFKDCFWIFANFSQASDECLLYAAKNISYGVLEYDYKYCKFRSPEKHIEIQGHCNCSSSKIGKLVSIFLSKSKILWWMSHKQKEKYTKVFSFLERTNNKVLSSVLSRDTLDYISSIDITKKNNKWIILGSNSWIKGTDSAVNYAKDNNLEYEIVGGIKYEDFLKKLAASKGIIFFPPGGDTCPRMIIEAKLLGCELKLNEKVQHKDEEWFNTKESCLEYLKTRASVFWNEVEKYITYLPNKNRSSDLRYVFVSPFYNAEPYLPKCINSLKRQNHSNFKCILIDDVSTDESVKVASLAIDGDKRFKIVKNKNKNFALKNIYNCLSEEDIDDQDVIVLLDGDDWLSSHKTLNCLNDFYEIENCWSTYGSYILFPHGIRGPEPSEYPSSIIKNNTYRSDKWRASHLRTFKYHLWKKISEKDLKNEQGYFYDVAYDQAIMLPILEMAGEKAKFVDSILHVYNKENPLNVDKVKTEKQVLTSHQIRQKEPYRRIK